MDEQMDEPIKVARNEKGKFLPGQSGNPSGRPKLPAEFRELARVNAVPALKKAIALMNSRKVPPQVRLQAAQVIMERAWGKPPQQVGIDGKLLVFAGVEDLSKEERRELLLEAANAIDADFTIGGVSDATRPFDNGSTGNAQSVQE